MQAEESGYDVFISYRREGGSHYARMLDLAFRLMGVRPFFDREELKYGYFDESIYRHIEQAKYFLFVLSPNALKKCNDGPEDWVRRELVKALEENKRYKDGRKIVVVSPEKEFSWPTAMPDELEPLRRIQGKCIDFENDSFVKDLRELIRDCLRGVDTDEDRRAAEMKRAREENDFSTQALIFWTNDGRIDNDEQSKLEEMARNYKIDDNRRTQLVQEARLRYEENQRKIERQLGRRVKRFLIRAGILTAVVAVIYGIAWYKGYQAGKLAENIPRERTDNAVVVLPSSQKGNGGESVSVWRPESGDVAEGGNGETKKNQSHQYTPMSRIPCFQDVFVCRSITEAKEILHNGSWNGLYTRTILKDFRSVLGRHYRNPSYIASWTNEDEKRVRNDPITKAILQQVDFARQEPLKLVSAGMQEDEIISARPDLVMRMGDIRLASKTLVEQMISEEKHLEALAGYESVKTAFKYCGMEAFARPDFSRGSSCVAIPVAPSAKPAAPRAVRAVGR